MPLPSVNPTNTQIADKFDRLADLLEIEGANPFRIRAYRNAAARCRGLSKRLADMVEAGEDLSELPDIGEDIAEKIAVLTDTGRLPLLEEVEARTPGALSDIMHIKGLGARKTAALHEKLGIESIEDLRKAVTEHRIRELSGFGEKSEKLIADALAKLEPEAKRMKLADAEAFAESLVEKLEALEGVKQVTVAGSYRRRKETVGDLDILVTAKRGAKISDRFVKFNEVEKVVSHGETRSTVILENGLQVDLRVVPAVSYGAAMVYFTGSKAHNIELRKMAQKRGLKINEYGVFKGDDRVAGRTENEVYKTIGLPRIEPELRENRGEIAAAGKKRLPKLVTVSDLRGDLHMHTRATDGRDSLRAMAEAARDLGHEYIAITDHTKSLSVANGLDAKRLRRQMTDIDRLNEEIDGITVLKSAEVEILEDGSLDFDDALLDELDLAVCAVHSHFGLSRKKQTDRLLRAMDNPHCHVLAHPTCRLIGEREPIDFDLEAVMKAARQSGCLLEVNGQPKRLDLDDNACRTAKDMGVKVVISTDAHSTGALNNLRYGVDQARRGWLEKSDVANTRSLKAFLKLLRR